MVEFYRCSVCGNMVALIKKGGGTLVCCGKEMVKLEANSTDASQEKHVPVVTKEGGKITAAIGSVAHPMLPEHFIEWIAIVCDDKVEIKQMIATADKKLKNVGRMSSLELVGKIAINEVLE